jgi:hypothetical protein
MISNSQGRGVANNSASYTTLTTATTAIVVTFRPPPARGSGAVEPDTTDGEQISEFRAKMRGSEKTNPAFIAEAPVSVAVHGLIP